MALRQGVEALQQSIDRAKAGGGDRTPTNFFQWADGETKYVRFLTDISQIYVLHLHDWHLCADGKHRTFVCRKELGETTCEICSSAPDARRREMGYGLAVLREPVRNEQNQIVGYQDKVSEVDGKIVPYVGVVRQAPTNFWIYVQGIAERYGNLRDYDLEIQRKGGDKTTMYMVYQCPPVAIDNIDERYANYTPDLAAMLEAQGSEKYYAAHLHGVRQEGGGTGGGTGGAPVQQPQQQVQQQAPAGGEMTEFERLRAEQQQIAAQQGAGQAYS